MTAVRLGVARMRGATDFHAGRHSNPYDASEQGPQFQEWIGGYHTARAAADNRLVPGIVVDHIDGVVADDIIATHFSASAELHLEPLR